MERIPADSRRLMRGDGTVQAVRLLSALRAIVIGRFQHIDICYSSLLASLDRRREKVVDLDRFPAHLCGALLCHFFHGGNRIHSAEIAAHEPAVIGTCNRSQGLDAALCLSWLR